MFATPEEFLLRTQAPPAWLTTEAIQAHLEDVEVWLRSRYRAIPKTPTGDLADALRVLTIRIAQRVITGLTSEGRSSVSMGAGPFTRQESYKTPDMYMTRQEQDMLEAVLAERKPRAKSVRVIGR